MLPQTLPKFFPALAVAAIGCAVPPPPPIASAPVVAAAHVDADVASVERAFAATMAKRDFEAFQSFLADETVFLSARRSLRGKPEVAAAWKRFFESPAAPFSWEPE